MRRALLAAALLIAALLLALAPAYLRLVQVVGGSDVPVLPDGAMAVFSLVAYDVRLPYADAVLLRRADPRPGELILFTDPDGHLSTKHVRAVDGDRVEVIGLDPANSRDSRHYGPIPRQAVLGRLLWRDRGAVTPPPSTSRSSP